MNKRFVGLTVRKPRFAHFLFMALTLFLAACSATGSLENSVESTPTARPQIAATPESTVALDDRLLASLKIPGEPDELVFLDEKVWTKTAAGYVVQIDPSANEVTAEIKVDTTTDFYHYCNGLGTDGEYIWACSARGDHESGTIDVVRVDPTSRGVVQTVEVDKIWDQLNMPFLAGQIWVLTGTGDKLVGIEAATGELSPAVDLAQRCTQLAAVGEALFASCPMANVILQIDPETGEITRRIDSEGPGPIAGNADNLWIPQQRSLLRLDASTLRPIAEWRIGGGKDLAVTDDAVWVRSGSGFLYHIDPTSNKIVELVNAEEEMSSGSLLVTAHEIWTTAYDNSLLMRISLQG